MPSTEAPTQATSMSATTVADDANPALKRLDALTGRWRLDGRFDDPDVTLTGWEAFEWLDGGYFMVVRWDTDTSGYQNSGIMVIEYDEQQQACVGHYFDNEGATRPFEMAVQDDEFTMIGETYRYTGTFDEDRTTITGRWEQREDGEADWEYFYDLTYTKTK